MTHHPVDCPNCGHEFDPSKRTWKLCLDCGMLFPPDGDDREHKMGPDPECVDSLGTWQVFYSESSAKAGQREWIQERMRSYDSESESESE